MMTTGTQKIQPSTKLRSSLKDKSKKMKSQRRRLRNRIRLCLRRRGKSRGILKLRNSKFLRRCHFLRK